jgi:hypothetical protein
MALLTCATCAACVFDLEPLKPSPDGGAGASGAGGGAPDTCTMGYACAPAPPVQGDVLMLTEASGLCPNGLKEVTLAGCSGCACNLTGTGVCDVAATIHVDNLCGGGQAGFTPTNSCESSGSVTGSNGGYVSALVTVNVLGDAACAPMMPEAAPTLVHGCVLPRGARDCPASDVCAPSDGGQLCVSLPDGAACPAGYPLKRSVTSSPDVAACSCACAACGDLMFSVFEEDDCLGATATFALDGTCKQTALTAIESAIIPNGPGATCASRGTPQAAALQVLCCKP